MVKLKVKPEGRKDMWVPEKESLKSFIRARKLKKIHNFIPSGFMMIGADHDVKSVLADVDRSSRAAVFTENQNMGHSLALIFGKAENGDKEELEFYDIGKITKEDLQILTK